MQEPPIPVDEASRINSLIKLDVLDTDPDERFDRITRLAKQFFDVPIALISLVDRKRQWFKSKQGLEVEETERRVSFCGHAILKPVSMKQEIRIMEIQDATRDERFADNPLVTDEPYIRFYAGFVLQSHDDFNLGTLCIIDTKPRKLTEQQWDNFYDLGMVAQNALQSLRHEDKDLHTELYNRRGFLSVAEYMLHNCERQRLGATLYYFDMINFATLVEEYGGLIEKEILGNFVNFLKTTFRKSDILARIDKERFVAVSTHGERFNADVLLKRFNDKVKIHNSLCEEKFKIKYRAGMIRSAPEYMKVSGRLLDLVDKKILENEFLETHSVTV